MKFANSNSKLIVDESLDRLLFSLAIIVFALMSPYLTWNFNNIMFRILNLSGDIILLYTIAKYNDTRIYNNMLVLAFTIVSIYTMIGGTENTHITYVPVLAILFIALKQEQQLRIFDYFLTIISVIFAIGLISYSFRLLGLNIRLTTAIAPNSGKEPYDVYFGHIEETGLPVYRFCSIFDESGVVGTISGLILASIGISKKDIRSLIILLAGLVSFSFAFYVILTLILLYSINLKYLIITTLLSLPIYYFSGTLLDELIFSRFKIVNGHLEGDNRTDEAFDIYYNIFVKRGGENLIFGKGSGSFQKEKEEGMMPSSYKTLVIDYGIVGLTLMICFYILSVLDIYNNPKGWFLATIFIVSAYQRPDLISYNAVVLFLGGLSHIKYTLKK